MKKPHWFWTSATYNGYFRDVPGSDASSRGSDDIVHAF